MDGAYVVLLGTVPRGRARAFMLGAGSLVFVPRGTAHTVRNSSDGPIRGLILISPGDAEHLFVPVEAG